MVAESSKAAWRKSSFCGIDGSCVEVSSDLVPGQVGLRDSKNPDRGALVFSPAQWSAFVGFAQAVS